jgi:uncharacterized protein YicC (UPF0701 family)
VNAETFLPYALALASILFSILIALVAYVFNSLKNDVGDLRDKLDSVIEKRARLAHRDDLDEVYDRLNGHESDIKHISSTLAEHGTHIDYLRKEAHR